VRELEARDLTAPMVLRFSDILRDRLQSLHNAFATAITENDYKNRYAAVFPIKVNQQRLVVEEVYRGSADLGFGLECGSKPELLAVMAMTGDAPERLIICNGFKDDSYIEAVILATKLWRSIIPVIENFSELGYILRHAEKYQVRPKIGVRIKLAVEGAGRWRKSAGDRSKFGLFTTEILELVEVLRSHGMLDCLKLVHCHPGSQLHDIRRVKDAVNELAQVYAELARLGAGSSTSTWAADSASTTTDRARTSSLDELFAARVRERRRLSSRERLQCPRPRAPDDHQRIRPRDRRASQRSRVQRARRRPARPLQRPGPCEGR
jgi:arginine decarboxylase